MYKLNKRKAAPRTFALLLAFAVVAQAGYLLIAHQFASAGYDGAKIINNSVFLDTKAMNKSDIQSFLKSKGSGLADEKFTLNCYGSDSKERKWYEREGAPCDEKTKASHIIYYASKIYGLNPRVVLATLQKEQSLITTANPTSWQIKNAMGYNCPTSGSCGSPGFFKQIDHGVWALRWHYERARGNNNWWRSSSSWVCGRKTQFYKPSLYPNQNVTFMDGNGVAYRTHRLANAATSAMYCYTPHAYNNPEGLYGRSSYGTKGQYYSGSYNFVYWFERWWGSTTKKPTYTWSLVSKKWYSDEARTSELSSVPNLEGGQKVYVKVRAKNTGNATWYQSFMKLAPSNPNGSNSRFYDDSWLANGRVVKMEEETVSPGEKGTFLAEFTMPEASGTYKEDFTLIAESRKWLKDIGLEYKATVTSVRDFGIFTSESRSKRLGDSITVAPGEVLYATVTVTNDTDSTWPSNQTKIGTTNPNNRTSVFADDSWLNAGRPAKFTSDIEPGETAEVTFTMTAPEELGSYTERFGLLIENSGWIDSNIKEFEFEVAERPGDELQANQKIRTGEELMSANGDYRAVLQGDGNLVVYSRGKPVWSTGTHGSNANRLVLQGDGNLVLYKNGGQSVWKSATRKDNPHRLVLQSDGNLVLYKSGGKAVWSSGTRGS